jgi:hypothetical protein
MILSRGERPVPARIRPSAARITAGTGAGKRPA